MLFVICIDKKTYGQSKYLQLIIHLPMSKLSVSFSFGDRNLHSLIETPFHFPKNRGFPINDIIVIYAADSLLQFVRKYTILGNNARSLLFKSYCY